MRKRESHSHDMDLSRDYLQDLGYEPRDVSLPVLVKWLVVLFIFFGATAAGTWVMYEVFVAEEPNQNVKTLDVNTSKLPASPNPLIQGYPLDDIHDFRHKEAEHLDGWYWKDKTKGIATMPVDKALDAIAEKGLPTRGLPVIDSDEPTSSTNSNPVPGTRPSGGTLRAPTGGGTAVPTVQHDMNAIPR